MTAATLEAKPSTSDVMTRATSFGRPALPSARLNGQGIASRRATSRHTYRPRGTALELFGHREPELVVSGPAGTGKSRACLEKVHAVCLKNPGVRALLVRKTAVSLTSTALVTWEQQVAVESLATSAVVWRGPTAKTPAQYRFSNGSTVSIGGMDKATRIMSSEYDLAYVQEATELTVEDWEAITTRLRNGRISFQQLIADCNPAQPTHWLKQRCDSGKALILHSRHEENPRLFGPDGSLLVEGEAYIAKLDNLTGVRKDRLRHGRWVAAEGIIYEDWDDATHLINRFEIPSDWPRWWTVDFGFNNPFVCQMWAEDPDGRLILYREFYCTQRIVSDHARDILDVVAPEGRWIEPKPDAVICDHDAEDRATLTRALGLATVKAKKTVGSGIQAVQERLKRSGDGKPRLFVMRDSLVRRDPALTDARLPACTAEEIAGYVWDVVDGKQPKESPVKRDDHGCDAMRYVVAHHDLGKRLASW